MRLLFFQIIFILNLNSQINNCGSSDLHQKNLQFDTNYSKTFITPNNKLLSGAALINGVYYLPIVVHIIHTGEAIGSTLNPSDNTVDSMINQLNQIFFTTHPNYVNINNGGTYIPIQFVLAKRTPNCTNTNGIVRFNASSNSTYNNFGVKYDNIYGSGIDQGVLASFSFWNSEDYINLWVVKNIDGYVTGYAYYPTGTPFSYEGIVIEAQMFKLDMLLAHEMGHYLNLRHTFEGSSGSSCPPNSSCSTQGDFVCDTDPHLESTTGIITDYNPCTGNNIGSVTKNIMSYSQLMPNRFTIGQKDRMISALINLRPSLISSLGADTPQWTYPSLTITSDTNNICKGQSVKLTAIYNNQSSKPPYYKWYKNGVLFKLWDTTFSYIPNDNDSIYCIIENPFKTCVTFNNTSNKIKFKVQDTLSLNSLTISTQNLTNCQDSLAIINSASNSIPNKVYNWYKNGVKLSDTTNSIISKLNLNDSIYCFINTNYKCRLNSSISSNILKPRVLENKITSLNISLPFNDTICKNSTPNFIITSSNVGSDSLIKNKWFLNNLSMDSMGLTINSYSPKLNDKFKLELTTSQPCVYPKQLTSNEIIIKIKDSIKSSISIQTDSLSVCEKQKILINSNTIFNSLNSKLYWKKNGQKIDSTKNITIFLSNNDVINCELFPNQNCVDSSSSFKLKFNVTPFRNIIANLDLVKNPICEGEALQFNVTLSSLNGLNNSELYSNNVLKKSINQVLSDQILGLKNNDTIYSYHYFFDKCNLFPTISNKVLLKVNPKPVPPIISLINGELVSSYANGMNDWYRDNIKLNLTTKKIPALIPGKYHSIAINQSCQSDISNKITINSSSIINNSNDNIIIYPNPTTGKIEIKGIKKIESVGIFNFMGQKIREEKTSGELNLINLADGIYYLLIENNIYKLIKSK